MKNYIYEASKRQWEKPTEPDHMFCAPAQVIVKAETREEAAVLAKEALRLQYLGSGTLLGEPRYVREYDDPVDWNYGYGDERKTGSPEDRAALQAACTH